MSTRSTTPDLLDVKTMSASVMPIDEDSISLPEGQITPPERTLGGMDGSGSVEQPQRQMGAPSSATLDITGHGRLVLSRWSKFLNVLSGTGETLIVDGDSLDVTSIVAVARYGATVAAGRNVVQGMSKSEDFLKASLAGGQTIYGVNTGFGGSANTHTDKVEKLQRNLISFLNCGIIASPPVEYEPVMANGHVKEGPPTSPSSTRFSTALPNEDPMATSVMPESWVRSALMVRGNSLASGNSGVRSALVDGLVRLLQYNVTPVIPLRGSISASGDLIPLSYVAGVLQGSPGVSVWMTEPDSHARHQVPADVALAKNFQTPLQLGPKEGLAIVNGTAVSAGVGALALHDAHGLMILSQILTAMGVEALRGSAESFDPFFSKTRPHPGQAEAARNIRFFLKDSKLISHDEKDYTTGDALRQDRYSIRTTPQWIGPQLENIMLADKQISVEVNSTTDNPLVDADNERILHGGNFQAMSVTSAMEKIRGSLQVIGRMLFCQCTELINPVFNNGLPPNLTADEPSQNFLLKGIDINVASLQAELGFLTASVQPHVQSAEMGNQSLNSLALLSARYTHTAINVLSQLCAAYLLTLCQALDLRALYFGFISLLEPHFKSITVEILSPCLTDLDELHAVLWPEFKRDLGRTTAIDSSDRFPQIIKALQPILLTHACSYKSPSSTGNIVEAIQAWTNSTSSISLEKFHQARLNYAASPKAPGYLGPASTRMYEFVRVQLGVPFNISFPHHFENPIASTVDAGAHHTTTIGTRTAKIHNAITNGSLFVPVMKCLQEIENAT